MQIVINIPEEEYEDIIYSEDCGLHRYTRAIAKGTPIPKGHGRLIDIDKFLKRVEEDRVHECYLHSWTADMVLERLGSWYATTIIEADVESEV